MSKVKVKESVHHSRGVRAADFIAEFRSDPDNDRLFRESEVRFGLSQRMKALRKQRGLSQEELACRVGCKQPFIAKLEAGAYDRVGLSSVRTYARAMGYDVSLDSLFHDIECAQYTGRSSSNALDETTEMQEVLSGRLSSLSISSWAKADITTSQIATGGGTPPMSTEIESAA